MDPSSSVQQAAPKRARDQRSSVLPRRRMWLVLAVMLLVSLGCINISYTVQFYPEGQGDGKVFLEIIVPEQLNSQTTVTSNNVVENLQKQGWINIQTERVDKGRLKVTAEYPFGPADNDPHLSDVLKNTQYKIEASESEDLYYTLTTEVDLTQLDAMWKKLQEAASSGVSVDLGELLGEQMVITQQDAKNLIATYGEPSYKLRVCLPGNTPVDISGGWSNGEKYRSGEDPCAEFLWSPGTRVKTPLEVQRRLEPETETDPAQAQNNLEVLFERYQQEIPRGIGVPLNIFGVDVLSAGTVNNRVLAFFNGGNYICSDYQERVLLWLDSIRTSPDPQVRALLEGLDYGPVQTAHGGHRSVVIYRSGGDWRTAGYVLDPWPNQKPEVYPIKDWWAVVPFYGAYGVPPEPDMDRGNLYPHLNGKPTSYPAAVEFQGDLSRGMSRPSRVLLVRSPVSVMLTFEDGRRVGVLPDGTQVNDLPGELYYYGVPKPGAPGEVEWLFLLPEKGFAVELTGTAQGETHMLLAAPEGFYGYGPQTISPGQQINTMALQNGELSNYVPPGGGEPIAPFEITAANMAEAMGLPEGGGQAPDNTSSYDGDYSSGDSYTTLLCCGMPGCLVCGGSLVAVVVVLATRKKKNRELSDG